MVNEILTKWPHLKKEFVREADAFDLWKYRLRTYFKNSRKRNHHVPEIINRQKKRKGNEDTPTQTKKSCLVGCAKLFTNFSRRRR